MAISDVVVISLNCGRWVDADRTTSRRRSSVQSFSLSNVLLSNFGSIVSIDCIIFRFASIFRVMVSSDTFQSEDYAIGISV